MSLNGQSQVQGEMTVVRPDRLEDGSAGSNAEAPAAADDFSPLFQYRTADHEVAGGLPLTVVYDILKNERRRFVLLYLQSQEGTVTTGELAEQIAAYENGTSVANLNAQQRKRVYIGLYQCHLPKLADTGAIEFEQSRGNVRLGPYGPALIEFLEESLRDDRDRHGYHGVLAVGVLVLAVHYFFLPGASWLLHVGMFVVVAGVLALGHLRGQERGSD